MVKLNFSDDEDGATTTVQIMSSKGDSAYDVVMAHGIAVSCTCPGFLHRRSCRHLAEAQVVYGD